MPMCLGPIPLQQKANVPTLGPRFLVKFLRVGKAIEVKCPTYARGPPPPPPHPLGLTFIHVDVLVEYMYVTIPINLHMYFILMILFNIWFANRGNVDLAGSSSRAAKAFLEISLKKKSTARWTGLEKPQWPGM